MKTSKSVRKVSILLGTMLLAAVIGSGTTKALAGQDIFAILANWFNTKQTESVQQIEAAITAEKEKLMDELRIAMQEEKQRAEEEIANFRAEEIAKRVAELQSYAASLNIHIDTSAQKAEISADLDATLAAALEQINQQVSAAPPAGGIAPPPVVIPKEEIPNEENAKPSVDGEGTESPAVDEESAFEQESAEEPAGEDAGEQDETPSVQVEELELNSVNLHLK